MRPEIQILRQKKNTVALALVSTITINSDYITSPMPRLQTHRIPNKIKNFMLSPAQKKFFR